MGLSVVKINHSIAIKAGFNFLYELTINNLTVNWFEFCISKIKKKYTELQNIARHFYLTFKHL